MNAKVVKDRRCEEDKRYDMLFNKMVRDANLSARQRMIVQTYLTKVLNEKISEVENAMSYAFWIGLIEVEHFGHNSRATRLPRLQKHVRYVLNDAYGHDCIDANGRLGYDGCGIYYLRNWLNNLGVEVEE